MKHEKKLIVNGNVVLPGHVSQVSLLVENGKIKALLERRRLEHSKEAGAQLTF